MASTANRLLGGDGLYLVNLKRLQEANDLVYEDPERSPRLRARLESLEEELDQTERAAMALVVIDRILRDLR